MSARQIGPGGLTAFVPNGSSRQETAIILVAAAEEYGLDQRSIRATQGGFFITDELVDVLYAEPEPTTTKTSGKRAAKKNSTKGE